MFPSVCLWWVARGMTSPRYKANARRALKEIGASDKRNPAPKSNPRPGTKISKAGIWMRAVRRAPQAFHNSYPPQPEVIHRYSQPPAGTDRRGLAARAQALLRTRMSARRRGADLEIGDTAGLETCATGHGIFNKTVAAGRDAALRRPVGAARRPYLPVGHGCSLSRHMSRVTCHLPAQGQNENRSSPETPCE